MFNIKRKSGFNLQEFLYVCNMDVLIKR